MICTAAVHLPDLLTRLLLGQMLRLHDSLYSRSRRCEQKYADTVFLAQQDIVCTPSHDNGVSLRCDLFDGLRFRCKDIVTRCFLVRVNIHLMQQIIQQPMSHNFLIFRYIFRIVARRTGRHLDDVLVIECKSQLLRQLLSDSVSAASILSSDQDAEPAIVSSLRSNIRILLCRKKLIRQKCQFSSNQPRNKTYQDRRDDCTFPHPVKYSCKHK